MKEESKFITETFREVVGNSVLSGKPISFSTCVLGDSGEAKIKYIIQSILNSYERSDLMELIYTACKELVVNSTKAAIKRILFNEMNVNSDNPEEYDKGMQSFKVNLSDKKFPYYKEKMKTNDINVKIKFFHNKDRLILNVINNFPLLKKEEDRIREKFVTAKSYDNLFEFFTEHGDNTEGAGMGITLVEILMAQCGLDRHLFTIFTSEKENKTIARIEIPLNQDYKPRRMIFDEILSNGQTPREDLRKEWSYFK
ncbi:MAG: hypothetical protein L6Q54_09830 [Leptospiraceae bacterium]|nr:hypothetical protein [Leptospiraceae bacterium]MCK6381525.1 hypothetical protein [Leptospiraceae bacterium]NUM40664.1 hypothetical protein [Leptospiraceae bacterium]